MTNTEVDILHFKPITAVSEDGSLVMPASKYSRLAIIGAFEMIGGMETFAQWAQENKSEFYTKLMGKIVGKEPAEAAAKDIDNLLDLLDDEVEDVTDDETAPVNASSPALLDALAEAAERYAEAEQLA